MRVFQSAGAVAWFVTFSGIFRNAFKNFKTLENVGKFPKLITLSLTQHQISQTIFMFLKPPANKQTRKPAGLKPKSPRQHKIIKMHHQKHVLKDKACVI